MRTHLTDTSIRKLTPPERGTVKYWDTVQPGFGVRVGPKSKSYFVVYGERRTLRTIAPFGEISLAEARKEARRYLDQPTGKKALERLADALLMGIKDIWRFSNSSTAVLDDLITFGLMAIMDDPKGTLLHLKYLLTSEAYREYLLPFVSDQFIKDYWIVFEDIDKRDRDRKIESTLNKANVFVADYRMRRTFGQVQPSFTMPGVLKSSVFLARLPQGQLGVNKTRLYGMLLLSQLYTTALRRTKRTPFHVYLIDTHLFQGQVLLEMLASLNAYGVSVHTIFTNLDQLTIPTQQAVLGTSPIRYIFNLSRKDTEVLETEMQINNSRSRFFELPPYFAMNGDEAIKIDYDLPTITDTTAASASLAHTERHYHRQPAKVDKAIDRLFLPF